MTKEAPLHTIFDKEFASKNTVYMFEYETGVIIGLSITEVG